jgi:hypothetical protein
MRLYDTATGEIRELAQREPGTVSIYLCGPTVYGPPHLGHGRATLAYDILRRYLEWRGVRVRLVSNITDIDDKIIERAQRESRDAAEIARRCEAVWWKAMDAVNAERPTDTPHATEWVDEMVTMIGELVTGSTSPSPPSRTTACWRTSPWPRCAPGAATGRWSAPSTSATRPTSPSGSWPSRASRRGRPRGARAARAGTPSAS